MHKSSKSFSYPTFHWKFRKKIRCQFLGFYRQTFFLPPMVSLKWVLSIDTLQKMRSIFVWELFLQHSTFLMVEEHQKKGDVLTNFFYCETKKLFAAVCDFKNLIWGSMFQDISPTFHGNFFFNTAFYILSTFTKEFRKYNYYNRISFHLIFFEM